MTKLEKFKKLINEGLFNTALCTDHMFGGTRVNIYTTTDSFGYVYRQLAYYSSTWEDVYITGITIGICITMFFEGEVFDL